MRESGFDHFDPESWEREGKEKRRNEIVIESLAASAAGEACPGNYPFKGEGRWPSTAFGGRDGL